jgi:hypothetical protein
MLATRLAGGRDEPSPFGARRQMPPKNSRLEPTRSVVVRHSLRQKVPTPLRHGDIHRDKDDTTLGITLTA